MKEIRAGEFKSKCLKLMDVVQSTGREIVITKYGKPVAKLTPIDDKSHKKCAMGFMKGGIVYRGDVTQPTGEKWNAQEG